MIQPFVHLHVHSEYSFVDGSIRIPALIEAAKKFGHSHIALTDHTNMHGAIEFYFKARESGLTPIVGCEIYIADKNTEKNIYQLVLLAQNTKGYKNLLKVVSSAYIGENFKGLPVVPFSVLAERAEGLLAISSFHKGEFRELVEELRISGVDFKNLKKEDPLLEKIENYLLNMQSCMGSENFYVEITDNDLPGQKKDVEDVAALAKLMGVPLVASANAHYLTKDFADTHALAVAMKNSLTLKDIGQRLHNVHFHLMDNEEMNERFQNYPEALSNTLVIAERCSHLKIETGHYYFPKIHLSENESTQEVMRRMSCEGLQKRLDALSPLYGEDFTEEKKKIYWDRLEYELGVIEKTGFIDYFLIVQDFIRWAKEKGIPVGPGRGSGAGSLVAYSLLITDLDPLRYDLIFERFLNPERISMPDFDVDFCQWRRDEVIQYCINKYGKNNVAQITTFGKMNAKGAVKAVGRAKGLGFTRVDQFTKLFPNDLGLTLQNALDQEPRIKEEMARDDELRECMEEALKLEGLCSHTSVHAAGIVMSDGDMTDYVPIYTTDGSSYITQYEMKPTEKVGLVKFDFLGLKTLTVIDKAIALIQERGHPDFDISKIPLDAKAVFQLISAGHTTGVFQCESPGITQLIRKMKPSTFDDMIALVALYRPGPLGSGMVDDFVKNKHGHQKIKYLHPSLEPILKETYGMILYQDQVLRISAVLAGYSLGEADLLRKAMGKKIPEEMAKQKERFLSGTDKNEIPHDIAEQIFDLMAEFAKYGFNKAHSAAYGLISYQTAYLKTFFPECYLAACMTCDMDNTDKIVKYVEECKRFKIEILSPNINRSHLEFLVPHKGSIDFALCAIKGLGEGSLRPLLEERQRNGPFLSLSDLARRVHLGKFGKKNLQLLVASGALDDFSYKRKVLDELVHQLVEYSTSQHEATESGQRGLFDLTPQVQKSVKEEWFYEKTSPKLKAGEKSWDITDLFQEKKLLGTFISEHPLKLFHFDAKAFAGSRIADFEKLVENQRSKVKVCVFALLTKVEFRRSKKGSLMAYLRLEQEDGAHEGIMFSSALEGVKIPEMNSLVIAEGSLDKMSDEMPLRFNIESITDVQLIRKAKLKCLNFHFTMSEHSGSEDVLSLKRLVEKFPGETPIRFFVKNKHVTLKVETSKWNIFPSNDFINHALQIPSLNLEFTI